ncbi:MAG TPA: S9 family peptidase [Terriglobia bacterium]|nr:S9 family peptidase [Terriglobia bacterium]
MTSIAPFGSWTSPISTELLTSSGIGFSELQFSKGHLYWLESRPDEAGRVVIVRCSPSGTPSDAIEQGFNARTRVHEYGGGAYFVHNDSIFFSNFKDQRLWRQAPGGVPSPITPDPASPAGFRYADGRVTPDGKTIICVRERHEEGRELVNEIVAIPVTGSAPPRVILNGYDFYSFPRISPDGKRLAWTCWRHPQMPWDGTELWVGDLDSDAAVANPRRIAGSASESIFQPEWASDGSLYFISDRTGWWNLYAERSGAIVPIYEVNAEIGVPQWLFGYTRYVLLSEGRLACIVNENGFEHVVLIDPQSLEPRRLPLPYSVFGSIASDGAHTLFFAAASPSRAAEVATLDLRTDELRVMKRSLDLIIEEGYISKPEPIEFPTANGQTAFALFYPPQNKDFTEPAGQLPPLIVISHGGPTSATTAALRLSTQYWTSRGFAIVDVNYGGSTGYGRTYRERLKGNWGVVDVEDCINAARYLENRGDADGRRMAIRGGSAGGYTTLCALVFHNVFAAGASYYGVADLETLVHDTHKFESRYEESLVGPYPETAPLFRQRSPVNFADRLSCPVILLQGLEDKVVPPSQAEVMIAALRAKRLPFAYVAFPTEGHGFREAANIRRSIEAELFFYSRIFGFTPADQIEPVEIENLEN